MRNIQIFLDRSLIFVRLNTIGYPNSSVIKGQIICQNFFRRLSSTNIHLPRCKSPISQILRSSHEKTILLFAHYKFDHKLILQRLGKLNGFLTRFCHCFCWAALQYDRSKMMDSLPPRYKNEIHEFILLKPFKSGCARIINLFQ